MKSELEANTLEVSAGGLERVQDELPLDGNMSDSALAARSVGA